MQNIILPRDCDNHFQIHLYCGMIVGDKTQKRKGNHTMKRKGGFEKFSMKDYTITKDGDVINNRWNRKVKPQLNGKGYLRVYMCGKMRFVHRLVAEKFVPNPDNKPQVNHKDGDKTNNHADNLEWVNNQENRNHAVKNGLHSHGECSYAKLDWKKVAYIRNHRDENPKDLAKMFSVSPSTIRDVWKYRSWK